MAYSAFSAPLAKIGVVPFAHFGGAAAGIMALTALPGRFTVPICLAQRVLWRERMAALAMRFSSVNPGHAIASEDVRANIDHPKMLDIRTGAVATQVVDGQSVRDFPVFTFPCSSVCVNTFPTYHHSPIAD